MGEGGGKGVPRLRARRGDVGIAPYKGSKGVRSCRAAGCTPRVLASLRGHRPLRKDKRCGGKMDGGVRALRLTDKLSVSRGGKE